MDHAHFLLVHTLATSYRIGDHAVLASWLTARTGRPLRTEERRELSGLTAALRRSLDALPALERAYRAAVGDG
ncbi:MAG TPA: hypothetical protein DD490_21640 [Acidobacteria bacterium]|nr:hypothetical protein [Acidobacteriota bacterium]